LNLKSEDFKIFLKSLSKISDTSILEVSSDEIYSIAASEDRAMFLWATLSGEFDLETSLNLPSISKMCKLIDLSSTSDIKFNLNGNRLEYKSKTIKFKYHLYDDGILTKPKVTLSKIKALKFDYEFDVSRSFIKTLLANCSVFKDTNKLYIYTEDGHLVWSLADKTIKNTDTLTIIGEDVDFEMDDFILNLDNVRLIDFGDSDFATFEVSKNGMGKISIDSNNIQLNYIVSSLTK